MSNRKTRSETETENKISAQSPAEDPAQTETNNQDILTKLEADIFSLVDDYKNTLDDPNDLKEYNGIFVDMLKYIYKYYLKFILKNDNKHGNRYDYKLLDDIWSIYTQLVYKYKKNKRILISEFTLFVNISYETINNIKNGLNDKASVEDIENIKRWYKECENCLVNGGSVFEIFLLKSCHGYNDNLAPIPLTLQGPVMNVNQLPDLSANNSQKLLKDSSNPKTGKAENP